jgi:hypothetical protein
MPKILASLFALVSFLFFQPSVFADANVVVNEFYALGSGDDPDWIELYNRSDSSVNLEGWIIRDETDSNKIALTGYICPKGHRKFDFSNRLNNSGDKIRLFDSESSTTPIDELVYFSNTIPTHPQNQSTSRNPDGDPTWVLMTSPTPTNDNSCTPSPTPTPTPTSSPTSTPTPTPTPVKSPSPTPKTTPTPIPTKSPSPTAKISPAVLGETQDSLQSPTQESTPSPSANPTGTSLSKTKVAAMLTGSGAILIGLSVGFYLWYNKVLYKKEGSQDKDQIGQK